jgi:hypothetical protein
MSVQRVIADTVVRTDLQEQERSRINPRREMMGEHVLEVDVELELGVGCRRRQS